MPRKTTAATAKTPPTRTAHHAPRAYSPRNSIGGKSPKSRRRAASGSGWSITGRADATRGIGFAGSGGGIFAAAGPLGAETADTSTGATLDGVAAMGAWVANPLSRCSSDFTCPINIIKRIGK